MIMDSSDRIATENAHDHGVGQGGGRAGGSGRAGSFRTIDAERAGGQLFRRPPARHGDGSLPVVGAEVVLLERHLRRA